MVMNLVWTNTNNFQRNVTTFSKTIYLFPKCTVFGELRMCEVRYGPILAQHRPMDSGSSTFGTGCHSKSDNQLGTGPVLWAKFWLPRLGQCCAVLSTSAIRTPSAKLDTAQHWPSIAKNIAKDRLPILCLCWNCNFDMHLVANSGPNYGCQDLFSAQQRADTVPNFGFLNSRMVCLSKSETWPSNVPSMGRTLDLLLSELDAIVKVTISLV